MTQPEYDFLADVADRVIAVGDVRKSGPRLLSTTATNAGLDTHFRTQFERYRSFPTENRASLQLTGEGTPALCEFYKDEPWEEIAGDLTFLNIQGDEATPVETLELESTVPAAEGTGKRLVFDVTDTPLSAMAAHELFENRIELDATALREESVVVLDSESLYLASKGPLEGERASHHQVVVQTVAAELPEFNRALLANDIAGQIVTQVVESKDPDVVVTPFERHGTHIKRRLAEKELDVPVRRPEDQTVRLPITL
ncbi:hypothetical protein ACFQL1_16250 [Halomicroarcula sp. GCM10025709]|uniref:hypothetical protein n=1 Tax=Halomicroarcula sp. GCM10025709 TaxID=3252669 RepID=UPI0036231F82